MILSIIQHPNNILSTPTEKVREINDGLKKMIDDMVETMRDANGVGLAAPQIGQNLRLTVIEFRPDKKDEEHLAIPLTVLINPKIISKSQETEVDVEGC